MGSYSNGQYFPTVWRVQSRHSESLGVSEKHPVSILPSLWGTARLLPECTRKGLWPPAQQLGEWLAPAYSKVDSVSQWTPKTAFVLPPVPATSASGPQAAALGLPSCVAWQPRLGGALSINGDVACACRLRNRLPVWLHSPLFDGNMLIFISQTILLFIYLNCTGITVLRLNLTLDHEWFQ